jgi:hypothetical protein
MPVCSHRYSANRSVVQLAVSCPTGVRDPTRSRAAVRRALAAVTVRSRPGALRHGTASTPPVMNRLSTRTTVSWLRSTVWAIWVEV